MAPKEHSATLSAKPDRTLRRWVFCIAGLVVLVTLFYLQEDWRGHRAWVKSLRDMEATGIRLNWDAYVPPPVPDEENVFKAPYMQQWFVKGSVGARSWPVPGKGMSVTGRVYLAELRVVPLESKPDGRTADAVLRLADPAAASRAVELVQEAVGPSLLGSQNLIFLARRPAEVKPVQFAVETENNAKSEQLRSLFLGTNLIASPSCRVQVQPGDSNVFFLWIDLPASCYAASDYLDWNKQLEPDLDIIRAALKRPYARMDGNYTQPFAIPIPNFVAVRSVVQILAQRAQCHLLLGEPEAALSDLTLLNNMRSLLEAPPTHRPIMLVATMINVAVTGLYAEVVADGLRLGAWRDADLKAIQEQLTQIHLLPYLAESLACERAATCHTFLTTSPGALNNIFSFGRRNAGFWDYIKDPASLVRPLMPRGWIYQNLKTFASLNRTMTEAVDPTNLVIDPKITESANQRIQRTLVRHSPYNFLVAVVVPNFARAAQNLARTESRVRQALLACALERYRLTKGRYPENLEQLVPGFISEVPHDVIKGAEFKYRAPESGGFLLYSVGWDERDNGGFRDKNAGETDWVWQGR